MSRPTCCLIFLSLLAAAVCAQQAAQPQVKVNPKDQQQYLWIAPGQFTMGCSPTDRQCAFDENPAHSVEITRGFWMGQTPITVAAWKHYRSVIRKPALPDADEYGRKVNEGANDDNQPVVEVTWDEARGYCAWAGMRLPTEAEWEFAARAGTTRSTYDDIDQIAWYADNSGRKPFDSADVFRNDPSGMQRRLFKNGNGPHDVRQKAPNPWGLYDMLGNVSEWTADYYAPDYYSMSPARNPAGPTEGTQRVLRGGSWRDLPNNIRASYRITNPPGDRVNDFGFRCAGDLP